MTIDKPSNCHSSDLETLWIEAFNDTKEFFYTFRKTAFSPERCRCVFLNGKVVAALYWFDCSYGSMRFAYLYAIATKKEHRDKGLCTALMENTHEYLKNSGYEGTILLPSSVSLYAFYGKMGYSVCSHVSEFECSASEKTVELRETDAKEYALLRRKLLPQNAVIQENENLSFLEAQESLYAAEGILFAATRENGILKATEFLGNTDVAADIVNTLGCKKGIFRIAGADRQFAMSLSFGEQKLQNVYFGLAFD